MNYLKLMTCCLAKLRLSAMPLLFGAVAVYAEPFTSGPIDIAALELGAIHGQDRWTYEAGGASRLQADKVAVAEAGLGWLGSDGARLDASDRHLHTQAGIGSNGKMDRWLHYTPVQVSGPVYVRMVAQMETRPAGSTIGANDAYELFFGFTLNPSISGAPWEAYVAVKYPVGGLDRGVETTNSGGVMPNSKLVLDQPLLLVARYEVDTSGNLSAIKVWVNPTLADADAPDHVATFTSTTRLGDLNFFKYRVQNAPARLDHLLITDSWEDAVPPAGDGPPPAVAPEITVQQELFEAETGDSLELSVTVTGTAPFTYQWTKDGEVIAGAESSVLVFSSLTLADSGVYRVLVSNAATTEPVESAPITLTVAEPPPAPEVEVVFVESFDAVQIPVLDGETGEPVLDEQGNPTFTRSGLPLADYGWNLHHSFAGVYLPGLPTGNETGELNLQLTTASATGDPEFGASYGYAQFFINDNYPLYGSGNADNPGAHPVTGQYYHNRTLALFLWKNVEIDAGTRSRLTQFNFVQGNRDAVFHSFSPAVRIGDEWFVYLVDNETLRDEVRILGRPSQNGMYGEEGVFQGGQFHEGYVNHYNAQPYHFAWSESGWTRLVFDGQTGMNSTVGMVLGEPLEGELPAGAIDAIGVFSPENLVPGYNFNGHRIDSIHLLARPPAQQDLFTFTFNNEGKVDGVDRPIQAANWDGVYTAAALPLVTSAAVLADLSEGVTNELTPGAYKAGFLFVSGRSGQAAPQAFLVHTRHLNVVNEPQWPQGGLVEVNPQTDWFAEPGAFTQDLGSMTFSQLQEITLRTNPRNVATVTYHFAVELDGVWYVSAEGFQRANWEPTTLMVTESSWYTNIVGDSFLNVDLAAEDSEAVLVTAEQMPLAGVLTGIGFYINTGDAIGETDSWARVDSITVLASAPADFGLPPKITQQPASAAVLLGSNATFSVVAESGEDELTYQWLKNGEIIEGAQSASYIIEAVTDLDAGAYAVRVANPAASTLSMAANLVVLPLPVVSPEQQSVADTGGSFGVAVTADLRVDWTAQSDAGWITVTSGATGNGNGTVGYSVAPNNNVNPRSGSLTVAGQTVQVEQAGAIPFYDVFPEEESFGVAGGTGMIEVTVFTEGATWQMQTDSPWIVVDPDEYGASAEAIYTVLPNSGAQSRVGTIEVAGFTVTVNQQASAVADIMPGAVFDAELNGYIFGDDSWLGVGALFVEDDSFFLYSRINRWWAVFVMPDGLRVYDYAVDTWLYVEPQWWYPWVYSYQLNYWLYIDPDAMPRKFWIWDSDNWFEADDAIFSAPNP